MSNLLFFQLWKIEEIERTLKKTFENQRIVLVKREKIELLRKESIYSIHQKKFGQKTFFFTFMEYGD